MKLYITRHGETPMNAAHRVCGRTDIDLTETGVRQAIEAGQSLIGCGIRRIIASPMRRAQHTAQLIAREIGVETIETDPRLIEQDYGIYENTDWDGEAFNRNKRQFAVRFAFLLSIPAVVGAAVFQLPDIASAASDGLLVYAVGFVTAAVSGYLAIRLVRLLMKKNSFKVFSVYCAVVGVLSIVFSLI